MDNFKRKKTLVRYARDQNGSMVVYAHFVSNSHSPLIYHHFGQAQNGETFQLPNYIYMILILTFQPKIKIKI